MPSDDIPVSRPSFCTPRSSKHIIRSEDEGFLKFKQRNYPEFFVRLAIRLTVPCWPRSAPSFLFSPKDCDHLTHEVSAFLYVILFLGKH